MLLCSLLLSVQNIPFPIATTGSQNTGCACVTNQVGHVASAGHGGSNIDARYFARVKQPAEDTLHLLASSSNEFVALDISTPKAGLHFPPVDVTTFSASAQYLYVQL